MKTIKIEREPRSFRGFTLIEMLVTVGIIVVLAALLSSALPKVLAGSGNVKCVSNLRSIGSASMSFFTDNEGELFPSFWWYNTETASPTLRGFIEYLGVQGPFQGDVTNRDTLLTCPSYKRKYPALYPSNWNRAYSLNYFAHAYDPGAQQGGNEASKMYPGNLRRVRSLSKMWLFMDGAVGGGGGPGSWVFSYMNNAHQPYLSNVHSGKQNAVFFDGHVGPVEAEQIGQPHSSDFWGGPHE
jgi:prepilin-type N-terminal cleavage/methylation domain-containing protein/prepilin-type processing-associated H-X9-DG protein